MTLKDYCKAVWEEKSVVRFPPYVLYEGMYIPEEGVWTDPIIVIHKRSYDRLNINWKEIDFSRPIQEIALELYNRSVA
jgi:hypothetical protein